MRRAAVVTGFVLAACSSGSGGGHLIITPSYPEGLPSPEETPTVGAGTPLPPPPPIGCFKDPTCSGRNDAPDAASKAVDRDGSTGDSAAYLDAADSSTSDSTGDVTDSAAGDGAGE